MGFAEVFSHKITGATVDCTELYRYKLYIPRTHFGNHSAKAFSARLFSLDLFASNVICLVMMFGGVSILID